MQTGNLLGIVTQFHYRFSTLGSLWDRFVFPATPMFPLVHCAMLSANPNKGDKWKR
jgi:hypothetical protein